jgi:cell division septation protein DedD
MIRLILFSIIRFFIVAIVVYVLLLVIRKVAQLLKGGNPFYRSQVHDKPNQPSPKKSEEYRDVQDAQYKELPKSPSEENADKNS